MTERPARLRAAQAFILVTSEYNHSYPASLKATADAEGGQLLVLERASQFSGGGGKWIAVAWGYKGVRTPLQLSFAEFYLGARDDCLRAVLASVGDRAAAEDFVAEAFTRAWASWRKVSQHPQPRAWVVRTALNFSASSWRRRSRHEVLFGTVPGLSEAAQPGQADPADLGEADAAIMAMLAALPERQRQVIALRVFLDLDTVTTAEALGIAPGTVTAHLARATTALRAQLSPTGDQEMRR